VFLVFLFRYKSQSLDSIARGESILVSNSFSLFSFLRSFAKKKCKGYIKWEVEMKKKRERLHEVVFLVKVEGFSLEKILGKQKQKRGRKKMNLLTTPSSE